MSDIDEVKARLDIVDIVGARVTLKKAGRNFKGLCPFHQEKSPSFIVSPDRQTFHCFGCGKGGSIFDFFMLTYHVDFSEALESLADMAGVKLERKFSETPEAKLKQKILEVNALANEYYQYLLMRHSVGASARSYLANRGVSEKSIATFSLGYSANTWDGLSSFLTKKGYDGALLERAGLVIRGGKGYYDRFRGRVMFALKDHRGTVLGFSGRVLDADAKEAKYINTSETPVYTKGKVLYALDVTKDAIQKANEAIVMEGELDVISSFQAGIPNVVAIKGSAVTEDHAHLLRRFTERLVFALDSDMAGDAASRRGIEIAERNGFDMRVLSIPHGKDPDEAARENPGLLKKAVKEATPIYEYFIRSAVKRYDVSTSYGKKKVAEEVLPSLAKIENPIVQGHYIRELSTALSVSTETVEEGLARLRSKKGIAAYKPTDQGEPLPKRSRLENAEVYVLTLLLQGDTKRLFSDLVRDIPDLALSYLPVKRILDGLREYLSQESEFVASAFAATLPAEQVPAFDEAFLLDISELLEDPERFMREWKRAIVEVRRLGLRQQIEAKTAMLRDQTLSQEQYAAVSEDLRALTVSLVALEKSGQIR